MSLAGGQCNAYLLLFLRTGNLPLPLTGRQYSISNPEQGLVREIAL